VSETKTEPREGRKSLTADDIRSTFLRYFEERGHRPVPSSPLVPQNDPTLLFANAGMNQFKDVFLGKEKRDYKRAASSQKCVRAGGKHNDLENVGRTARHHTFFEMLGNFSFGDYFKKDAIAFAWELLTRDFGLDKDRLKVTIFDGEGGVPRDAEAHQHWRAHVPEDRIVELGLKENFWAMGETGPCGPCSEIHFFQGDQIPCAEVEAGRACLGVACECDRWLEIWNLVFMQYNRDAAGNLEPLPAPCIDTGMGLERIAAVVQGKLSNYDTDLFQPLLQAIAKRAGTEYGRDPEGDISLRVVADHLRATTFLISDGVIPGNEGRGYVLRKIMRRAMRHGRKLGLEPPFLHELTAVVAERMSGAFPELRAHAASVARVVRAEEERFGSTLKYAMAEFSRTVERLKKKGGVLSTLPGADAFRLYDTYGLPVDFLEELAQDYGLAVDREGFEKELEGQRERARQASKMGAVTGEPLWMGLLEKGRTQFLGYDNLLVEEANVLAVLRDGQLVSSLDEGQTGQIILDRTPFYAQAGGQVGDHGSITARGSSAEVVDTHAPVPGLYVHDVTVRTGGFEQGLRVRVEVDEVLRTGAMRHHTGTHLLHAALRDTLGTHVKQAGSLVAPDRLRFDFAHFSAVTREQWLEIEGIVNAQILKNTTVTTEVKNTEEAIAAGAMALFGEKYGDSVRVVSIPGFSTELCGGTHVRATGDIGLFAIAAESGVAAGVRRIEATTGAQSLRDFQSARDTIGALGSALNATPAQLAARVSALQDDVKRLGRDLQQAKTKAAMGGDGAGGGTESVQVAGVTLIARQVEGLDKDGLRALVDRHRDQIKSGVVVLAAPADGKVLIVAGVTPDLVKKIPAGQIVKQLAPIVGGGGGGRPDFAEAGGKDPSKIAELLAASRAVVEKLAGA
jgi:alanyl-tRNA synthetase